MKPTLQKFAVSWEMGTETDHCSVELLCEVEDAVTTGCCAAQTISQLHTVRELRPGLSSMLLPSGDSGIRS